MKNALVCAMPKSAFLDKVTAATREFKAIYDNGIAVKTSGKAGGITPGQLLDEMIANFGPAAGPAITKVVADLGILNCGSKNRPPTDEELAKQFLTFVPFACVVPMRNRNNHDYTIGEPVIMIGGDNGADKGMFGMDMNGVIHSKSASAKDGKSNLPRLRKSLRPATSYEIRRFVDSVYAPC